MKAYCAICAWQGPAFRKGRECPNCLSLERHRAFYACIKLLGLSADAHVLEVGPGPAGFMERLRTDFPHYVSVSPWYYLNVYGIYGDMAMEVEHLAFEDHRFDLVLCASAVSPEDGEPALGEIRRVLKDGGRALIHDRRDAAVQLRRGVGLTCPEPGTLRCPQCAGLAHLGKADRAKDIFCAECGEQLLFATPKAQLGGPTFENDYERFPELLAPFRVRLVSGSDLPGAPAGGFAQVKMLDLTVKQQPPRIGSGRE